MLLLKETRYDDLKLVLHAMQEAHQEHCTRMEGLMYNHTNEIREMHTHNEAYRFFRDLT